jgi:hypothetical protein
VVGDQLDDQRPRRWCVNIVIPYATALIEPPPDCSMSEGARTIPAIERELAEEVGLAAKTLGRAGGLFTTPVLGESLRTISPATGRLDGPTVSLVRARRPTWTPCGRL